MIEFLLFFCGVYIGFLWGDFARRRDYSDLLKRQDLLENWTREELQDIADHVGFGHVRREEGGE